MGTIPRYSKSVSFYDFFCNYCVLATVSYTFCRPHLPNVLRGCRSFNVLRCKPSSRFSPVHSLLTTCQDRAPHPQKQRPYTSATPQTTLPEETKSFAHENGFTRECTRSQITLLYHFLDARILRRLRGWCPSQFQFPHWQVRLGKFLLSPPGLQLCERALDWLNWLEIGRIVSLNMRISCRISTWKDFFWDLGGKQEQLFVNVGAFESESPSIITVCFAP